VTQTVDNVSWIEGTAKAVGLALNAGVAQKQADLLAESETELGRILLYFRDLKASAAVVSGLNWEGRTPAPALSKDLEDAIHTLDSRPLNRVQRALDQFGRDVATSLRKHWEVHAAQRLGNVGDLLVLSVTLSDVEGIGEVSQELSATLGRLERSRDSLPNSESAELLSRAEQLLRQLESSLKPDVVRRFLSAVARGGAPLESLTSDVRKWLADHHSLEGFKIVAGPPEKDLG
jgi:hypothetical protein